MEARETITIQAIINAPVEKVWSLYTGPEHVRNWNNASNDWHTPHAENDLRPGGRFLYRMEAKDGSFGFDFDGTYERIVPHKLIAYSLSDARTVKVFFDEGDGTTVVTVAFETESENPLEAQREGWQAILDNFKRYAEKR